MRRSQLVFVTVVFTALATGIAVERAEREDTFEEFDFTPRRIQMDPVEVPTGEHILSGNILDPAGAPASDVRVHLWPEVATSGTAEPLHGDATGANGRFAIEGLAAGEYRVALLQPGHPNTLRSVSIPATTEVVWTLEPPLPPLPTLPEMRRRDLAGNLSPPVGILSDHPSLAGYEVVLLPSEPVESLRGAVLRRARVDAAGAFLVPALVAADYRVQVLPPWAAGGTWPILDDVDYSHSAEAALDSRLALRLRTGELAGRLVDGSDRPVEGALVKVWPVDQENHLWPPLQTDVEGFFLVHDLPPGAYVVRVRAGEGAAERTEEVRIGGRTTVPFDPLAVQSDG